MEEFNTNVVESEIDFTFTIIEREDGYHVVDTDGNEGPACTRVTTDGYLYLSPNVCNRKFVNYKNLQAEIAANGKMVITGYKATKVFGPVGNKLPNEKLIAYLSEEEQAEYKAIIDRAIAARDAAKAKPLTDKEKLMAKIAKAQAALEKLMALADEQ